SLARDPCRKLPSATCFVSGRATSLAHRLLSERGGRDVALTGRMPMEDVIRGVSLEQLATLSAKYGELKAQYAEKRAEAEFGMVLATQGLDRAAWSDAWNGWWARFRSDPTGRLQARYHEIEGELSRKAHFGDVRDMSQDQQEGVTLERYVQITL